MKKEEYANIADSILSTLIKFCNENKYEFYRSGKFSAFISTKKENERENSSIADNIRDTLDAESGVSKKKIQKVLDIVSTKKRIYILFKMQVQSY